MIAALLHVWQTAARLLERLERGQREESRKLDFRLMNIAVAAILKAGIKDVVWSGRLFAMIRRDFRLQKSVLFVKKPSKQRFCLHRRRP